MAATTTITTLLPESLVQKQTLLGHICELQLRVASSTDALIKEARSDSREGGDLLTESITSVSPTMPHTPKSSSHDNISIETPSNERQATSDPLVTPTLSPDEKSTSTMIPANPESALRAISPWNEVVYADDAAEFRLNYSCHASFDRNHTARTTLLDEPHFEDAPRLVHSGQSHQSTEDLSQPLAKILVNFLPATTGLCTESKGLPEPSAEVANGNGFQTSRNPDNFNNAPSEGSSHLPSTSASDLTEKNVTPAESDHGALSECLETLPHMNKPAGNDPATSSGEDVPYPQSNATLDILDCADKEQNKQTPGNDGSAKRKRVRSELTEETAIYIDSEDENTSQTRQRKRLRKACTRAKVISLLSEDESEDVPSSPVHHLQSRSGSNFSNSEMDGRRKSSRRTGVKPREFKDFVSLENGWLDCSWTRNQEMHKHNLRQMTLMTSVDAITTKALEIIGRISTEVSRKTHQELGKQLQDLERERSILETDLQQNIELWQTHENTFSERVRRSCEEFLGSSNRRVGK